VDTLRRISPDSFLLSHFHADHYSGLLDVGPNEKFDIARVYFPCLPVFLERKEFMLATLAMSYYTLGASSGSQEADFITRIKSITRVRSNYYRLSAGDPIDIDGSHFEVLWPPKTLNNKTALAKVKKAVTDFQKALEEDEKLRQLHERVQKSDVVDYYLRSESRETAFDGREPEPVFKPFAPPDTLPEVVARANDSLRDAANHMSLALCEDNRFLFLGDLEKHELKEVTDMLVQKRRTKFLATLTPHHGTHWHPDLNQIETQFAVSSAGRKLVRYFRPEFKQFGRQCFVTHTNGEIHIPSPLDWGYVDPSSGHWHRKGFWPYF
jgi:beta-lactamase superfamily II metal-dependent hydrolase